MWNAADCRAEGVFERNASDALALGVDWSDDGRGIWAASRQGLRRWDIARSAFVGSAWATQLLRDAVERIGKRA